MSSKFSPKFTIATAYPMMYCPSDLQYIESEMIDIINADTALPDWSEPLGHDFWDAMETTNDLYVWAKNNESYKSHTLRRLERLWQKGLEDFPRQ